MKILDHLPTLTLNPANADRLKQLVLELAVRGKLTEIWRQENPDVEPASELLSRIQAEKARLIKKKKIKKEKSLPNITEDEIPYQLPENWVWYQLGDIARTINGDRGKNYPSKDHYVQEGVPFISAGNIQNNQLDLNSLNFITKERYNLLNSGKIEYGDILYCLRGSLGKTAIIKEITEGAIASSLVILRFSDLLNKNYVLNFLLSPVGQGLIKRFDNGSAQPNLSANNVRKYVLPIPPLAEQKAIVSVVDELMERIDALSQEARDRVSTKRKLAQAALHHLTQPQEDFSQRWHFVKRNFPLLFDDTENVKKLRESILQLAVQGKLTEHWRQANHDTEPASELLNRIQAEKARLVKEKKIKKEKPLLPITEDEIPYQLPEGWVWCRLGDISSVGTGATPLTSNSEYYHEGDIPWITSSATNEPFVSQSESFITEKALKETNCTIYNSGTLIIAMYGQGKTRGQITELLMSAATNQACAAINLFIDSYALKNLVKLLFQKIYREIRELASGGAQPNLNLQKIKSTAIPLPPQSEQKAIVTIVDELMQMCDQLEAQTEQARDQEEAIMQALMHQVFHSEEETVKPINTQVEKESKAGQLLLWEEN